VASQSCELLYKTTDYWSPAHERCIRWDDPTLAIEWPLRVSPLVSAKDAEGVSLRAAETYP
jgi:dTDP-4-dehydrorhamnose 3,5-epimerase